jgi:hypothetical protein
MSTTETEYDGESQYKHPISVDIVQEISREHNIPEEVLHGVLTACEELWEPHTNEFHRVLDLMEMSSEFDLLRYPFPDEGPDEGVTVLTGATTTVIHLLGRINLDKYLETENVARLGIAHAVWTAHRLESKRLTGDFIDCPVVIRTPKFCI